jgi:hypothetical protein
MLTGCEGAVLDLLQIEEGLLLSEKIAKCGYVKLTAERIWTAGGTLLLSVIASGLSVVVYLVP